MDVNTLLLQCNSWNDFKDSVAQLDNTKEKGDCFEVLTQHDLTLNPKYKTQRKIVWRHFETPTKVSACNPKQGAYFEITYRDRKVVVVCHSLYHGLP